MSFKRRSICAVILIAVLIMNNPLIEGDTKDGDLVDGNGPATRSSQYYNSPTGGKWVYDFSDPDPLSVLKNLSIVDGTAELKERFELDDFTSGTPGTPPSNWVESDPAEGDLVLDGSVYGESPNSARYTTVNGGQGYSVTRTITTIASSDTMELRFSIRIEAIIQSTSDQGLSCRVHYSGQNDGPEFRFHSNRTISIFGWDGSGNSDSYTDTTFSFDTWMVVTVDIDMTTQSYDLHIGTESAATGAVFRSSSGNDVLFMNSLTFETGSGNDGGDFYLDDMFCTKNTIDQGSYTSPTISKTVEMEWQYLQVFPERDEDLLTLSLLNVSSGLPYAGYNGVPIPSNGRIDMGQIPGTVQNFRVEVTFRRDGTRRPALDLVGASWFLSGHFFDPLFPGTGLMRDGLDHVKEGMELEMYSPGNYATSGTVITPVITINQGSIWGTLQVDVELPTDTNIGVDVVGPSDQNPLPGIPTSHDGTMDLFQLGLDLEQEIRIMITLSGTGSETPTIEWISLQEPVNTDPYFDDLSLDTTEVMRISNVSLSMQFGDLTDHPEDIDVKAEYLAPGSSEWESDLFGKPDRNESRAVFMMSIPKDLDTGIYRIRGLLTDRNGAMTFSDEITLLVENRIVSSPVIEITPNLPFTDSILRVRIMEDSIDPEGDSIQYRFYWYVNGGLVDPEDPKGPDVNYTPENTSSRESSLNPGFTRKGDNISCMVVPTDLIDDGIGVWAYTIVNNSPPRGPSTPISLVMEEDTSVVIDLGGNFTDVDNEELLFTWDQIDEISIQDVGNGSYLIVPAADLFGEVSFNVTASDGSTSVNSTITLTYTPINDLPYIEHIDDRSIQQGDEIDITIIWGDAESGDDTVLTVGLPASWGEDGTCVFDDINSTIIISAENGNVGNHTFVITVMDREGNEFEFSFNVSVANVNDPLEGVLIISPEDYSSFETGDNITFTGEAVDPDIIHGQEMVYKWFLVTEQIGTGSEIQYSFDEPGTYVITLEVSEGTASKSSKVTINITKKDDGGGGGGDVDKGESDDGLSMLLIGVTAGTVILALLVIVFIAFSRKKKEEPEDAPSKEVDGPTMPAEAPMEPVAESPPPPTAPEVEEPVSQPAPIQEPEPPTQPAEPDILMPSADDILMPSEEDVGSVQLPEVEIPPEETPSPDPGDMEEETDEVEYYSPSDKK